MSFSRFNKALRSFVANGKTAPTLPPVSGMMRAMGSNLSSPVVESRWDVVFCPLHRCQVNKQATPSFLTSPGNERRAVFKSKRDREKFIEYLESAAQKYDALIHTYCLVDNDCLPEQVFYFDEFYGIERLGDRPLNFPESINFRLYSSLLIV